MNPIVTVEELAIKNLCPLINYTVLENIYQVICHILKISFFSKLSP